MWCSDGERAKPVIEPLGNHREAWAWNPFCYEPDVPCIHHYLVTQVSDLVFHFTNHQSFSEIRHFLIRRSVRTLKPYKSRQASVKYGEEIDRESELIKKIRSPISGYCNLSCSFEQIVSAWSKKWFWSFVCLKVDNYASSDPISKVFNLLSHLSQALMSNLFSQTSLIFLTKGLNMNYGRNFTFPTLGCCFRTLQHLYER